jgi:hypothetical protein
MADRRRDDATAVTYDLVPTHFGGTDITTVEIIAKKLRGQSAHSRGPNAIRTGSERASWRFVMPNDIADTISHTWEPYESIATRLAQTSADIHRTASTVGHLAAGGRTLADGIAKTLDGGDASVEAMKSVIRQGVGVAMGQDLTSMMNYRIDTPLLYKDSQRRQFSLIFELGAYDKKVTRFQIFDAIRKLQELSCPEMTDDFISIRFPAVFNVRTVPNPIIKINHAALQAVQTNWKPPYKNGYPLVTELQLTFIDIEPLFRRSFERGGIVRTS